MKAHRWKIVFFVLLGIVGVSVGRPAYHLLRTYAGDQHTIQPTPSGYADDVSRLNATPVRAVWSVPAEAAAAEAQLVQLLRRAQAQRIPVAIAGARHSMGGHTIAPDGIVIDMLPFQAMRLSADKQILTVQAGARWADILPFLDEQGRSVAVMQSDHAFSVGGSLSTNVHGWQSKKPPIAATVRSFRLLTAEGQILRCSRTEHAALFSLVLGGYGLFGIILDAELWTVPNEWYAPERFVFPADAYAAQFQEQVTEDASVVMAYGRLNVAPEAFLEEAMLTVFRRATLPGNPPLPALGEAPLSALERTVFRGSVGSDYGKALRWTLEGAFSGYTLGDYVTRNQLLNTRVDLYMNRSEARTEVIHEYFVPPEQLAAFLAQLRHHIPQYEVDLLNVTLRDIQADTTTFLRFANEEVIAAVMLFSQARTSEADSVMAALTQVLIDACLELGGTYYLPYRPHATVPQFTQAYPQAPRFFALKKHYDPHLLFSNRFFLNYGVPLLAGPGAEQ